jgi:uncharacterized protein (DUF885 family)
VTDTRAASAIDEVATRFWEGFLELSPITATQYGDERYADRLPDPSPEGRAKLRRLAEETRAAALGIDEAGLAVEDRITRDMLRIVGDNEVEGDERRYYTLQVVDPNYGPQTLLPQVCAFQPADTPERLERFMARLRAYPAFMEANRGVLREGIAAGLTSARVVVERVIAQLDGMLAIPIDQAVVPSLVRVASDADRELVRQVVRDVVYPADAAFLETLRKEYLPAARQEPGIGSLPDGQSLYRMRIRHNTTLDLTPEDLHEFGRHELAEIDAEWREIARGAGFDEPEAYRRSLESDAANIPTQPADLIEAASRQIAAAMSAAPRFFGRLPAAPCEVRPVEAFKEKDAPFAYYYPPAPDGSRPGLYYVNTYDLPTRTFSKLASVTSHEAVPGHHFQIALEVEHPSLNVFRRLGSRLVGVAYAEGWGLYAERLADEMGIYRDEAERFGMLDHQAWRAARLVGDTGLHAFGWRREQSVQVLRDAGLSATDASIETDRYICGPGQALAYKVGQREIERLRAHLEARDRDRFDLRAFHDAVLGHGSVPLATLAKELPDWVQPATRGA